MKGIALILILAFSPLGGADSGTCTPNNPWGLDVVSNQRCAEPSTPALRREFLDRVRTHAISRLTSVARQVALANSSEDMLSPQVYVQLKNVRRQLATLGLQFSTSSPGFQGVMNQDWALVFPSTLKSPFKSIAPGEALSGAEAQHINAEFCAELSRRHKNSFTVISQEANEILTKMKDDARKEYLALIQRHPLLAYIQKEDPDSTEIKNARGRYLQDLNKQIKTLKTLDLESKEAAGLALFEASSTRVLKEHPKLCGSRNALLEKIAADAKVRESVSRLTGAATYGGCAVATVYSLGLALPCFLMAGATDLVVSTDAAVEARRLARVSEAGTVLDGEVDLETHQDNLDEFAGYFTDAALAVAENAPVVGGSAKSVALAGVAMRSPIAVQAVAKQAKRWSSSVSGRLLPEDERRIARFAKERGLLIAVIAPNPRSLRFAGKSRFKSKIAELKNCKSISANDNAPTLAGLVHCPPGLFPSRSAWEQEVQRLEKMGIKVHGQKDGYLAEDLHDKKLFFSDYDLEGVYDINGRSAYNETIRQDMNRLLGRSMFRHGPLDEYSQRKGVGLKFPQVIFGPKGSQVVSNESELRQVYRDHNINFDSIWAGSN